MKEMQYHCDLCRGKKPADNLVGYSVTGNGQLQLMVKQTDVEDSEHHICKSCIQRIKTTKI